MFFIKCPVGKTVNVTISIPDKYERTVKTTFSSSSDSSDMLSISPTHQIHVNGIQ